MEAIVMEVEEEVAVVVVEAEEEAVVAAVEMVPMVVEEEAEDEDAVVVVVEAVAAVVEEKGEEDAVLVEEAEEDVNSNNNLLRRRIFNRLKNIKGYNIYVLAILSRNICSRHHNYLFISVFNSTKCNLCFLFCRGLPFCCASLLQKFVYLFSAEPNGKDFPTTVFLAK